MLYTIAYRNVCLNGLQLKAVEVMGQIQIIFNDFSSLDNKPLCCKIRFYPTSHFPLASLQTGSHL